MNPRVLAVLLIIIASVVIILLVGVMGIGKKIGAPGLDTLVSRGIKHFFYQEKTGPFPNTTQPEDMQRILGTWSGVSYLKELIGIGLWTIFAGFICNFLSRKNILKLKKPSKLIYLMLFFPAVLYSVAVSMSHAFEIFDIRHFMLLAPLFIMLTAHVVFLFLLRAPTSLGRKVLDNIDGFRRYLAAAEGDKLDRMTPPEKTPRLYQAYLPYALALGVENRWSEMFSGEIDETYTLPPLDVFLSILSRLFSTKR